MVNPIPIGIGCPLKILTGAIGGEINVPVSEYKFPPVRKYNMPLLETRSTSRSPFGPPKPGWVVPLLSGTETSSS